MHVQEPRPSAHRQVTQIIDLLSMEPWPIVAIALPFKAGDNFFSINIPSLLKWTAVALCRILSVNDMRNSCPL